MLLTDTHKYTALRRLALPEGRHYVCPQSGAALPSVTTILEKTSNQTALLEWRKRVGEQEAARISREATNLGSLMHQHLECHILGQQRPGGNNLIRQQAEAMADQIIEHGLCAIDEVFGCEVSLYYPGLYAGTADGLGILRRVIDGEERRIPVVFDFKTARKMKKKEYIENYFLQLTAYALAANDVYGHNIEAGIIFMVDRDFNFREFFIEGEEFAKYREMWLDRLDMYYGMAAPACVTTEPA
jgi:genome maintenance exonuclease 1